MTNPLRGWGSVWYQDNPAEPFELLTCIGAATVTYPKPPNEARYCPDITRAGRYKINRLIQGEPDLPGTTLTQLYDSVQNFLLQQDCDFQLRINHSCEDTDKSVIGNYLIGQHLHGARTNSGEVEDPVSRQPGDEDEVIVNGEIVATAVKLVQKIDGSQQTLTTTTAVNDIEFLPSRCYSKCVGSAVKDGEVGWAVLDTAGYLAGDPIVYTIDYGQTWNTTATEPFGGSRNCLAVELIQISGATYRVLVAGDDDAGQPAEVSYSDDEGVTWNDVAVGSTAAQGLNMLHRNAATGAVWAAADGGYIYVSTTQGASWTAKASGTPSTEDLFDIVFFDKQIGYAVGENNEFWYTIDGGDTWAVRAGPAGAAVTLHTVAVNHVGHVFVGTAAGTLYRSRDGGVTWDAAILTLNSGTGAVKRVRFDRDLLYFGYLVYDTSAPVGYLYRTEDGGPSWTQEEYITNSGLNAVYIVNQNHVFTGGEAHGGTSYIARYIEDAST